MVEEDNGLGDDQLFASYSNQDGFSEVTNVGKRVTESHDVPKSKQVVKSNMGLRDLDVSWKDDVECNEIELRESEMDNNSKCVGVLDELCKEIVGDSSNMEIIRLGLKAEQTTLSIHDDESNVRSLEDQSSFVADIKNVKPKP